MKPKFAQLLTIEANEDISPETHCEFLTLLEDTLLLALKECGCLNDAQYRYAFDKLRKLRRQQAARDLKNAESR